MKSNKGFTIVEVIVVAVIVMILSAVAIPMYGGYIRSARQGVVDNLAETAATAANNYWRRMNNADNPVDEDKIEEEIENNNIRLYYDREKHKIEVRGEEICVSDINHKDIEERCVSYMN